MDPANLLPGLLPNIAPAGQGDPMVLESIQVAYGQLTADGQASAYRLVAGSGQGGVVHQGELYKYAAIGALVGAAAVYLLCPKRKR